MKYLLYFLSSIIIFCVIGLTYFVYFFDISGDIAYTELKRVSSPDNKVEAILVSSNGGATTSTGYRVFIVPKGANFEHGFEKFLADHSTELKLYWKKNKLLEIQYEKARIFKFSNFWHSEDLENWSYVVELRLNPLSNSFSLSDHDRWLFYKKDSLANDN